MLIKVNILMHFEFEWCNRDDGKMEFDKKSIA